MKGLPITLKYAVQEKKFAKFTHLDAFFYLETCYNLGKKGMELLI